jgi:predicted esterase
MTDLAHGSTIWRRVTALRIIAAWLLAACLAAPGHGADDPLLVNGRAPQRIVITARMAFDPTLRLETAMARVTAGVLADLDGAARGRLARCVVDPGKRGQWRRVTPVAFLHLFHDTSQVTYEVLPGSKWYWLHRPGAMNTEGTLDIDHFEALIEDGPTFRGSFQAPASTPRRLVMEPPYTSSTVTMDRRTMRHRLYAGMRVLNQPTDRRLDRERFHLRIPRGYDPRSPAGLVVWASPTPSGEIPPLFDAALDDARIFAVGVDNAGNDRDVPDKFQLMFDAVATVSRRYHIDPRRVYIVGMSGGGKVSSILTLCFPEVFRGAMPIVGLASHHELPAEWGEHRQAYFSRPKGRAVQLATARPIAVITGPGDFNYREMMVRRNLLRREGFSLVEVFEGSRMGHELPPASLFRRALEFVDGPWKMRRQLEIDIATRHFTTYLAQRPEDATPRTAADRRALDTEPRYAGRS